MVNLSIGFVVGLVVGWNFLPQPTFVSDFLARFKNKT